MERSDSLRSSLDDLAYNCQQKLAVFRIKELQAVLSCLGLPKHGRKQVLVDKIMSIFLPLETHQTGDTQVDGFRVENRGPMKTISREETAKAIDDIYRKLCGFTTIELGTSESILTKSKNAPFMVDGKINAIQMQNKTKDIILCPCGTYLEFGTMIQCKSSTCRVKRHMNCVVNGDELLTDIESKFDSRFFCELCRVQRGDPFCSTRKQLLPPSKVKPSVTTNGSIQALERDFMVDKESLDLLYKADHELQVWCILLNDEVPFRIQWPKHPDLRINGFQVQVLNRSGEQLLGINGRDDGAIITSCIHERGNKIYFVTDDDRPFCIGVRIIRRLDIHEVIRMIPDECQGESVDVALSRIKRCVSSVVAEDGDNDLEVVAELLPLSMRCPIGGCRIQVAARFKPCTHVGCFDLNTCIQLNQCSRKWQCPICVNNYSLEEMIIDPCINQIARALRDYDNDVTDVEINADGLWHVKSEENAGVDNPWKSLKQFTRSDCKQYIYSQREKDRAINLENIKCSHKWPCAENCSSGQRRMSCQCQGRTINTNSLYENRSCFEESSRSFAPILLSDAEENDNCTTVPNLTAAGFSSQAATPNEHIVSGAQDVSLSIDSLALACPNNQVTVLKLVNSTGQEQIPGFPSHGNDYLCLDFQDRALGFHRSSEYTSFPFHMTPMDGPDNGVTPEQQRECNAGICPEWQLEFLGNPATPNRTAHGIVEDFCRESSMGSFVHTPECNDGPYASLNDATPSESSLHMFYPSGLTRQAAHVPSVCPYKQVEKDWFSLCVGSASKVVDGVATQTGKTSSNE